MCVCVCVCVCVCLCSCACVVFVCVYVCVCVRACTSRGKHGVGVTHCGLASSSNKALRHPAPRTYLFGLALQVCREFFHLQLASTVTEGAATPAGDTQSRERCKVGDNTESEGEGLDRV